MRLPQVTALLHHVNVDTLWTAFYALKRKAAAGVDGVTWQDYEADLGRNLEDLHRRVHRGAYRPQPSRRTYIPKGSKTCKLSIHEERTVKVAVPLHGSRFRRLRTNFVVQDLVIRSHVVNFRCERWQEPGWRNHDGAVAGRHPAGILGRTCAVSC